MVLRAFYMLRRTFFAFYYTNLLGFILLSDRQLAGSIPRLRGCLHKITIYNEENPQTFVSGGFFAFYKDGLPHDVYDSPCAI